MTDKTDGPCAYLDFDLPEDRVLPEEMQLIQGVFMETLAMVIRLSVTEEVWQ